MRRGSWCSVAIILAAAVALPVQAATILRTGSFGAGAFVSEAGSYALGPGRYRFTLSFTAAPLYQAAQVEKQTNSQFFCIDPANGPAEFPCGGNNVPTTVDFSEVTPTSFQAALTVNPPSGGSIDPFMRYEDTDSCCDYRVEFEAVDAGSYTLAVTAVPEATGWVMMVAGVGATGGALRRRRRAAAARLGHMLPA